MSATTFNLSICYRFAMRSLRLIRALPFDCAVARMRLAAIPAAALLGLCCAVVIPPVATVGASEKDHPSPVGDWKPRIHFSARPTWNNDPNGPILLNGIYHLYYQDNPYADVWGHMSWGHATSRDLLHWQTLPVALPEGGGVMNFNGTVVEDKQNSSGLCYGPDKNSSAKSNSAKAESARKTPTCLVAIYTGDSKPEGHERQNQNLAYSQDGGTTWTKYDKNPVLDLSLSSFRDPKVFWHEPTHSWVMVVVFSDLHSVQIFRSPDLKHWKAASHFGPAGAIGGVWECPDLLHLEVRDAKGATVGSHWMLSVNLNPGGVAGGSGNQYFLGDFDGTRFIEDHPADRSNKVTKWVDWGKDFYASTSFADIPTGHDPIWIAWMNNWQYAEATPSLPGRGEMTLARTLSLRQETPSNGTTSLVLIQQPVLKLPPADTHHQGAKADSRGANRPAKRVIAPSGGDGALVPSSMTVAEANRRFAGHEPGDSVYVLRASLSLGTASEMGIRLRRSTLDPNAAAAEETVIGIDRSRGEIFVDRRHSGDVAFSPDFPTRTAAPLKHPEAATIPIEIVVDRSSVELFAEDGATVLTNLIFPSDASQGIAFYAKESDAAGTPSTGVAAQFKNLTLVPIH